MSPPAISSLAACSSVEGRERREREEREGGREEREGERREREGERREGEGRGRERGEREVREKEKRREWLNVGDAARERTIHIGPSIMPTPSEYRQSCINDNFMAKVCPLFHSVVSVYSFSKDSTNRAI